jgi:hypothetical protein
MTETLLAINASPHVDLLDLCQSLHALSGKGLDSVWLLFGCVLMHARTVHLSSQFFFFCTQARSRNMFEFLS